RGHQHAVGADQRNRIKALDVADLHVRQVARRQVQAVRGLLGDDQRALAEVEALQLLGERAGLGLGDVEGLDDVQATLAVELGQNGRHRRAVHLAVDLLLEAARLGREGDATADEDRSRQCAMTRAAALLLLRLLGGAAHFRASLLRLGTGTTGIAVRDHDLVNQVTVELATEHHVGYRHLAAAIPDREFHRHLSLTLPLGTHDHVSARCAGNRALHGDQAALGVDPDHFEVLRALLHRTHVAGHLLARKHAAGRLALTDRARRTVRQRVAVRRVAHGEVPALDRALEALALGHALDVDHLADLEDVGLDLAAHFEAADLVVGNAQLPQAPAGFDLGLGQVTGFGLVDQHGA